MANQEQSNDGKPHKDADRPSPDVDSYATDGQSDARGKGATDEQGAPGPGMSDRIGPSDPEAKDLHGRPD